MTQTEMIALLRIYIEAPDTTVYSDDDLILLLTEAYKSTVNKLDNSDYFYDYSSESVTLAATMTLSASWRKILRFINLDDEHEYRIIDIRDWPRQDSAYYLYQQGTSLKTFQDPINSNTYTVFYAPAFVAEDYSQLPDNFHNLIVLKAAISIGLVEKARSDEWRAEYQDGLQDLMSATEVSDGASYVRQTIP
jgi:hypothetical protein